MHFAAVFPGQGSQSQGMLADLAAEHAVVQATFAEASDVLGYDLWQLVQDNPDKALDKTVYTQPAMLAAGVAAWRVWCEQGGARPDVMAGHSLGEYSALVAAEAMTFETAVALVAKRAELMQAAVPEGQGAMAALLGLDDEAVIDLCAQVSQEAKSVVEAVNFNAPGQVVIAGSSAAVDQAVDAAKQAGARRALVLPVSVPSHSSLMREAAQKLAVHIEAADIQCGRVPVVQNTQAAAYSEAGDIRRALTEQLYRPVQWVASVEALKADTVVEMGPGKVLSGLVKRICKKQPLGYVDSPKSLAAAQALWAEKGE